jgi:hypothetical protein
MLLHLTCRNTYLDRLIERFRVLRLLPNSPIRLASALEVSRECFCGTSALRRQHTDSASLSRCECLSVVAGVDSTRGSNRHRKGGYR